MHTSETQLWVGCSCGWGADTNVAVDEMQLQMRCSCGPGAATNEMQTQMRCGCGSDDTHPGLDSIAAITKKTVGKAQSVSKGSTNLTQFLPSEKCARAGNGLLVLGIHTPLHLPTCGDVFEPLRKVCFISR